MDYHRRSTDVQSKMTSFFAISSLRQANFPQTVFMDALLVFPLSPKFKGRFGEILQSKRRVTEVLVEVTGLWMKSKEFQQLIVTK